ncbi:MAG: hypothetical protein GX262_07960 [Clostridia bacterium]|jgi:hypothetical protein|nr:hypothetical protein [Clostridia bacterium]
MSEDKKRKNYPQKRNDDMLVFDDMDSVENCLRNDAYEEAVQILREGKRVGARRL